MKNLNFGLLFLALLLGTVSCKKGGIFCHKANGNTVTEKRDANGFNAVSLSIDANVEITQSESYSVEITGSDNLLKILETKVKGNTLKIGFKNNKCVKGNYTINIAIQMPKLEELKVSGSGDITVKENFESSALAINISGSGDISVPNKLIANQLKMNISGSGDIKMDSIETNSLDCDISGSGSIDLTGVGIANSEDLKITGSGDLFLYDFPVNNSDINISGSGTCHVNVLESLEAKISGSGDIIYKGNPTINQNISGSGSVRPY